MTTASTETDQSHLIISQHVATHPDEHILLAHSCSTLGLISLNENEINLCMPITQNHQFISLFDMLKQCLSKQ